jgi:ADP-heptose:LPS heptosyltransferase
LFVGTRWQSKQWFPAQMALCAELLHKKYRLDVALLGGKDDQELAREATTRTQTRSQFRKNAPRVSALSIGRWLRSVQTLASCISPPL